MRTQTCRVDKNEYLNENSLDLLCVHSKLDAKS